MCKALQCSSAAWGHTAFGHTATAQYLVCVAAGDKLSVALVDNAAAAAELLAWHTRVAKQHGSSKALRIWDLQRLKAYDKLHSQRQAAATFAPGHTVVI